MIKSLISILLLLFSTQSFADCYIMGDSITEGISMFRPDCASETKVGLNTYKALKHWKEKSPIVKDKVVISLGINDGNMNTYKYLSELRTLINANQVIWILPPFSPKADIVKEIANSHGDFVLNIDSQISKDRIHPTMKGYKKIAMHIKSFQEK